MTFAAKPSVRLSFEGSLYVCPRCGDARYAEQTHKAKKKLIYFSVADWLKGLFANEYLAR